MGSRRNTELLLLIAGAVPVLLIYAMYVMNTGTALSFETLSVPLGLLGAFTAAHLAIRWLAPAADPAVLPIVFCLSGIGITFVTRLAPTLAVTQVIWLFVSVAAMVVTLLVLRNLEVVARYQYSFGLLGVVLLLLPALFGTEISGSKLWLTFGGFSFQPGELAKICIILFLASYLSANRELLSVSTVRVGPLEVPRLRMLLPLFVMWGIGMLIVIFERDLGSAVLFFVIFVVMLYTATGRWGYVIVSLLLLGAGGVLAYLLFNHVRVRFQVWLDPFADPSGSGMQIVQSLFSLADGGLIGSGVGKGMPTLIPVVESDFIFSAIGEEMGLLGGSAILLLFMLLAVRGFTTAARAKSDLAAFVAVGLITSVCFQAFLIVGGVTRLLPLTGVTLPFMSQGGSSLLASFIVVGLLLRAGDEGTGQETEMLAFASPNTMTGLTTGYTGAFVPDAVEVTEATGPEGAASRIVRGQNARGRFGMDTPESGVLGRVALGNRLTVLVTFFTLLFAVLIGNLTYIQVVKADQYRQMPNNNHTIARSAYVQRGSIITADGQSLAESVKQADGTYVRNHPLGGMAAHTVGYLSTQFGATGIEASMNDALTGHADFSTWQNALYSLAGIEQPGNSVVLTIDSRIQQVCESVLEGRRGAIVVLNPATGAVLAKASAPTYDFESLASIIANDSGNGELVDRSTSALYTPGSTFKVVTLAAALDSGHATPDSVYASPASIDLGNAAVVNDHEADYGELTLRDALVYSSNTVFGQVGTELGASALVRYAEAFGFGQTPALDFYTTPSLMPAPGEMTTWETAWSACGQPVGEHPSPAGPQLTVMQNAVVAATIANGGVAMMPYVVDHILAPSGAVTSTTQPRSLGQAVSAITAQQVSEAMIGVVTEGTGQAARLSEAYVAGKTGTASVGPDTMDSLFIGFAPADNPTMAISICVEGDAGEDIEGLAAGLAGEIISRVLAIQGGWS